MLSYSEGEMPLTKGLTAVICDDHPQMRGGIRYVLSTMLGCEVVGETDTGEGALTLVEKHEPVMLVLDLSLAGRMNGRAVLREIRSKKLPVKVFIYTAYLGRDDFEQWFNDPDGPDGVDEKGTSDTELSLAFAQVLVTGQKYMPVRLVRKFMGGARDMALDNLTAKEFQVLKLAVQPEISIIDIAQRLKYSASTVRVYLTTIYSKLGLEQHNRAALMAYYLTQHPEISV
jgi:DNA-binding NarL/FixJ family response regulator